MKTLRLHILDADDRLAENIKWNGPNYAVNNEDRITMRIQPPKQVQLIFHRGAKVKTQPKTRLVDSNSSLLLWKENDRAIASFKSLADIDNAKTALAGIVKSWIDASMQV